MYKEAPLAVFFILCCIMYILCRYIDIRPRNLSATERGGASKANSAGAETIPSPYTQERRKTKTDRTDYNYK